MNTSQIRFITEFLSKYQIVQLQPKEYILSNPSGNLLVKSHTIDSYHLDNYLQELDENMGLDKSYITPLLHFQTSSQQGGSYEIKAIYQLDKVTLRDEIELKKMREDIFTQAEIWIIISSVVNSLLYLQQHNIFYGRLSTRKIFLQNKIRLLNPAIYNNETINISQISLHSPELKQNQEDINIYMSDVYLLGLCVLQAITLEPIDNQVSSSQIDNLMLLASSRYSEELMHVLGSMLEDDAEERPTFQNIKEYLERQIQLKQIKETLLDELQQDQEDFQNISLELQNHDIQNIDILETNNIYPYQQAYSQYEQAKIKYLSESIQSKYNQNTTKNTQKSNESKVLTTKCDNRSFQTINRQQQTQFLQSRQNFNSTNYNCQIDQFKLQSQKLNKTICKSNKIEQIKRRNSQLNKPIHTIRLSNHSSVASVTKEENPLSNPELMKMLKESIIRHQFLSQQNKKMYKNRVY